MELSEFLGYFLIVVIIAVLVYYQFKIFRDNLQLIKYVQNLFPSKEKLSVTQTNVPTRNNNLNDVDEVENSDENINISQIMLVDSNISDSSVFQSILNSINNYLFKNKGAVSDFMLIKDIVERNCDSQEEEINTQTPIPLYIGLMGTMMGIILGIGRIAIVGGGFSAFIENPQQAIGELMGGVALAMVASFIGIFLTTLLSLKSKASKTKLEADKNEFYSWIQAELLPALSGNMSNTLQLLQQNLTSFNHSFSSNIGRMENALRDMSGSFEDQLKILELLNNLDIKRMATANVMILQQFEKSTANFQQFATYVSETSGYIEAVRQLNAKVGEYMEQTSALTNLSNYFQEESSYFQTRRSAVNQAVVKVDDTLSKSFQALQDNAEEGINSLTHFIIEQQSKFNISLQNVDHQNQAWLAEQRNTMVQHINSQEELFKVKTQKLDLVIDGIKDFASVKESMTSMVQLLQAQHDKLVDIANSFNNREVVVALQSHQNKLEQLFSTLMEQFQKKKNDQEENLLFKQHQLMLQKQNERIAQLCEAIERIPSANGEVILPRKKKKFKTVALWVLGIMLFLASGSALFMMSVFALEFIKK